MAQKTVVVIGGPTASGKTAAAIRLALYFDTEIISADSRQCYRELNIGVARPSEEELALVPHHFIALYAIQEKITAATFEAFAMQKTAELFEKNDVVIMVGGTGLYIRAFCEGFDLIPDVPEGVQLEVRTAYAQKGLGWLQAEVQKHDPQFYASGEIQNPQRLMRALEVYKATGRSIVAFRAGAKKARPFHIVKLALHVPKEQLHYNINRRVDLMMEQGLLEEVKQLRPFQHLNALQTVGYKELFAYLNGEVTLEQAIETIKKNTRQYARRQLTWFKKDKSYTWFSPEQTGAMIDFAAQQANSFR